MNIETIQSVYFVGAGGIGMSALIRYFLSLGKRVAGYDRTPSELTARLVEEGAVIHYEEDVNQIPEWCRDAATTLIVYTPAIPNEHAELNYFRTNGLRYINVLRYWVLLHVAARLFVWLVHMVRPQLVRWLHIYFSNRM